MKKCHYMFATRAKSKILQTTTWNILSHYATNNIQNHVFTNKLHGNIPTLAFMMAGSN